MMNYLLQFDHDIFAIAKMTVSVLGVCANESFKYCIRSADERCDEQQ